jgi:hypothetical protein
MNASADSYRPGPPPFVTVVMIVFAIAVVLGSIKACHGAEPPAKVWFAYDDSMLAPVTTLAKTSKVIVIVNPDSGPGKARQSTYANAITAWRKVPNIKPKAYIDAVTWQGDKFTVKRPSNITDEKARYRAIYGLTEADGYLIDDTFTDSAAIRALLTVTTWTSATIFNPGEPVPAKHWLRTLPTQLVEYEDPWPAPANARGIWIVFLKPTDLAKAWLAAKQRNLTAIGFEDLTRHHKGEFQQPMPWWISIAALQ